MAFSPLTLHRPPAWAARRLIGTCEQACLLKKTKKKVNWTGWASEMEKKQLQFQFDKFHYTHMATQELQFIFKVLLWLKKGFL